MTMYRRTEITVETDRVLIIRRSRSMRAWCEECGCEVDMVDQGEAEVFTGMSGQSWRDAAQARRWHQCKSQNGTGLVCLESMLNSK